MTELYLMGKRFGRAPSSWFPDLEPWPALLLDRAAFAEGAREEHRAMRREAMRAKGKWR